MGRCSLHRDYKEQGDGILWVLQSASVIAASYSEDELDERARLHSETPVKHGDHVLVDGKVYFVRVLGNYSDCAVLDEVIYDESGLIVGTARTTL
jgi:hypothetical protein